MTGHKAGHFGDKKLIMVLDRYVLLACLCVCDCQSVRLQNYYFDAYKTVVVLQTLVHQDIHMIWTLL